MMIFALLFEAVDFGPPRRCCVVIPAFALLRVGFMNGQLESGVKVTGDAEYEPSLYEY